MELLGNIFQTDNIVLNLFLLLLPILLLIAATIMQVLIHKYDKYQSSFILIVVALLFVIFLYIFGQFDPMYEVQSGNQVRLQASETFNDVNLSIFGSILFIVLPLDIFATQNILSIYEKKIKK